MNEKPIILIVDDVAKNLQVLGAILFQEGYEIAMADNGPLALEMANDAKPDLILLDIMMPEMDGFEVCSQLKADENNKDLPIIFLTAKHETESIIKGFELGAVDYITKPFNSSELLARVKTHVDLRKSKEKIVKYNNQLKHLLEQKSEFLGIAAHDMKNPLNSIIGHTNFAMSDISALPDEYRNIRQNAMNNLKTIQDTSKFMFKTINELLNNETLESGSIKLNIHNYEIGRIIDTVIMSHKMSAETKNIKINVSDYAGFQADVDEDRFREICDNLISNAIKYSPHYKNIWVSLNKTLIEGQNYLQFSVRDEGPGLNEDDKKRVFGRFQKLSARPTGGEYSSGLGLSIVKKLVEMHGGKVEVESEPGKGAYFSIFLKLDDSHAKDYCNIDGIEFREFTTYSKNKKTQEANQEDKYFQLDQDIKCDYPDKLKPLLPVLENDYMNIWKQVCCTNVVNDIRYFAVSIRDLGKEKSVQCLEEYGQELNNCAYSFDIEQMTKYIEYFPKFVKKLSEISQS